MSKGSSMDLRRMIPPQSQIFFFGIMGFMLFLTWLLFKPYIIYIVAGVFVAVLAIPIDKAWEKIVPNKLAAFGTLFTVFLLISAPIAALGWALGKDANAAIDAINEGKFEEVVNDLNQQVQPMLFWVDEGNRSTYLEEQYRENLQPLLLEQAERLAGELAAFFLDLAIAVVVILFVVYYVLTDGKRLTNYLRRAAPLPAKQVDYLLDESHNGLQAVFYGQIVTSLVQGGLGGIGFLIAGVPGAILWAAVMAILSLLPVIGPPVVWIPAAIFLLATGEIWQGIFLIAWGLIIVAQIDNFLRPMLIGNRADIHPLFVLIGVLGGVSAFGFIGLFLGPLLVGITVSILKVWEADYLDPRLAGHVHDEDEEPEYKDAKQGKPT